VKFLCVSALDAIFAGEPNPFCLIGILLEGVFSEIIIKVGPKVWPTSKNSEPTQLPLTFKQPGAKIMKNVQLIVCTGVLVLAMSVCAVAKPGTISTTKAGTISTTKAGTISTTRNGVISTTAVGTISTTRASVTSSTNTNISLDRFSFVNLLLSVLGSW
jgi:hypothetical protein